MQSYVEFIPLVVLAPVVGSIINYFVGAKIGERSAGYVASGAAILSFLFSLLIRAYLMDNHGVAQVVDPPFLDGWIRLGAGDYALSIPWQFRVDTLTATMLLVVTGVGSLIHIYSIGYIHGDPKASLFFAYLNMFLAFMLLLVTGNNFLMMFVGWEGVGLCSFLLIAFWWDKKGEIGWSNSNAGRKAMILNRIGDFGLLIAMFLMFWTFGTLDYYKPGEIANTEYQLKSFGYVEEAGHGEEGAATEEEHAEEEATGEHVEEEEHGPAGIKLTQEQIENAAFMPSQLGVFGQAEALMHLEEDETLVWDAAGNERGREIPFGPYSLDIQDMIFWIVIFLLVGAAGKSAQIPLFVWLPDAMAGPTPVSALMHAATMVTAGVYLLARSNVLLELSVEARFVVAIIGASTALVAGIIAVGQFDIKRVLAFSTVSQLGFMVAAIGVGAYVAAMFHLVTHAVFKALLFLGSGSIIHGVEHGHHHVHDHGHGGEEDHHDDFDPQDMRNMGGLARRMPVTFLTYLIGTIGLMGTLFIAGFWSKDEILAEALHKAFLEGTDPLVNLGGLIVFGLLVVAAFFTSFYMWRQIQMVFFGEPRSEAAAHAPESTGWMTWPLVILAISAIFIGLINVPGGAWPFTMFYDLHGFGHYLESSIPVVTEEGSLDFNWVLAILTSFALPFFAVVIAHSFYAGDKAVRESDRDPLGVDPMVQNAGLRAFWVAASHRLYWDDFYHAVILRPYEKIGTFLADYLDWRFFHDYFHNSIIHKGFDAIAGMLGTPIDLGLIDGAVNGVGKLVNFFSGRMRRTQTGYVRTYAVALLFGVVTVIVLMLLPLWLNGS